MVDDSDDRTRPVTRWLPYGLGIGEPALCMEFAYADPKVPMLAAAAAAQGQDVGEWTKAFRPLKIGDT